MLLADWPGTGAWSYILAAHVLWSFVPAADQRVCRFTTVPGFCYLCILVPD